MLYRRSKVLGASQERLDKLIQQRLQPRADTKRIDRQIWSLFGSTQCVMFTDLSGFSRNVAKYGIIHFLQNIYLSECLLAPVVEKYEGLILKFEGDSFLAIFGTVHRALRAAVGMQRLLKDFNRGRAAEDQVLLGVGLGYGPMLKIGDSDIFGAEVNAASKLGEDIAKTGQILVTENVRRKARGFPGVSFKKIATVPPGAGGAYQMIYGG
jgi:adenylate cyclase